MTKHLKKFKTYLIIITFFYLSLIVSFFLNENTSGGSQADFFTTQHLMKKISEDILLGIIDWKNSSMSHFPLHYVVSAIFLKFLNNIDIVRFLFLNFSILIPFFFYKSIKIIFKNENAAILLSILIFISPYFRSSAIWLTTDNTALIFFTIAIFFFLKTTRQNNNTNINYYYYFFLLFFFASALTRQYLIVFLIFFIVKLHRKKIFFNKFKIKLIYLGTLLLFFFYIFGIKFLKSYNSQTSQFLTNNIFNNIYINLSIIFFYLSPLIFFFKENIINFFNFFKKNKYIHISFFLILALFLYKFDYSHNYGGGFYFKLTNNYYLTKIIFLFICFLSLSIIYYLTENNLNNFILVIILFSIFNYNIVYQKYFDPLLIIIFFTLFEHKAINLVIKKIWPNFLYLFIYFFLFWLISFITHI
jgi:hypothetical protein